LRENAEKPGFYSLAVNGFCLYNAEYQTVKYVLPIWQLQDYGNI